MAAIGVTHTISAISGRLISLVLPRYSAAAELDVIDADLLHVDLSFLRTRLTIVTARCRGAVNYRRDHRRTSASSCRGGHGFGASPVDI